MTLKIIHNKLNNFFKRMNFSLIFFRYILRKYVTIININLLFTNINELNVNKYITKHIKLVRIHNSFFFKKINNLFIYDRVFFNKRNDKTLNWRFINIMLNNFFLSSIKINSLKTNLFITSFFSKLFIGFFHKCIFQTLFYYEIELISYTIRNLKYIILLAKTFNKKNNKNYLCICVINILLIFVV